MRQAGRVTGLREAPRGELLGQFSAHSAGRFRVAEERGSERDRGRSRSEEFERVAARGHVNWLLVGLHAGRGRFASGAAVHADGNEVGRVTSAAVRPDDGSCVGLARVRRVAAAPGTSVAVQGEGGEIAVEVAQAEDA